MKTNNDAYIVHFKTRLKRTDRNKLSRENYCVPTNEVNYATKKNIQEVQEFYKRNNRYPMLCPPWFCDIPNDVFSDEEHYTKQWVTRYYQDCMKNFDLNMSYFSSLNYEKFNKHLESFVKRNRFKEIDDLKTVSGVEGLYILVLDEYKQVYIGISRDVKRRIMRHWSGRKEFDRLVCGKVEESILPIDSFGALDTTRIFYKSCDSWQIDEAEEKYVSKFKSIYRLNRVAGGINEKDDSLRNMLLATAIQKRDLVSIDKVVKKQ